MSAATRGTKTSMAAAGGKPTHAGAPWLAALAMVAGGCANDISAAQGTAASRPVVTYRAPGAAFATGATFAIVTKLGIASDVGGGASFVEAPNLLALITSQLEARGFHKAADIDPAGPAAATPVAADLSVNVTALESSQTGYGLWEGSPRYLEPAAWGYPGYAWHAPWAPLSIPFTTGTLLVEIGDLARAGAAAPNEVTLLWAAVCYGAASEGSYDGAGTRAAMSQAFAQSTYVRAGGAIP